MDHSAHAGHGAPAGHGGGIMDHSAMGMVWNWGYDTVIVFSWWKSDSPASLFVSCVSILLLSFLFEGFRSFRTTQDRRLLTLLEKPHDRYADEYEEMAGDEERLLGSQMRTETEGRSQRGERLGGQSEIEPGGWSEEVAVPRTKPYQLYRALLHGLEVFYGYFLMMAFMTLNGYICISLVLGSALGFFVHQKRTPSSDIWLAKCILMCVRVHYLIAHFARVKLAKEWANVDVRYIPEALKSVLVATRDVQGSSEIVVPMTEREPWSVKSLTGVFSSMSSLQPGLDSVVLGIMSADSTVVYYRVHKGLVPPEEEKQT
ncbi:Ctr copper transporter family-domain-containing protein [Powellomyces hirtus]|nr:Ctr copper transporter family-domain-containing protein [Powellomyces hirtus]